MKERCSFDHLFCALTYTISEESSFEAGFGGQGKKVGKWKILQKYAPMLLLLR